MMATYTTVLAIVNTKDGVWDTVPVEIDTAFLDVWFADEAETGPVTPRFRLMRPEELGVSPDILTRHITLRRIPPPHFDDENEDERRFQCYHRLNAVPVTWRDEETGMWPAPEMERLRQILDMECDLFSTTSLCLTLERDIVTIISLIQMIRRGGATSMSVRIEVAWYEMSIDDMEAEKNWDAEQDAAELTLIGERLSLAARGRLETRRWAAVTAWELCQPTPCVKVK